MTLPSLQTSLAIAAMLQLAPAFADGPPAHPGEGVPDTQQIIEALQPPPVRTRSSRNLIIREKDAQPGDAAASTGASSPPPPPDKPPSISMAIQFDFDSARLRPQGEAALDGLAAALKSPTLAGSHFMLEGHTDAKGVPAYNLRLSRLRADEVRRYLVAQGVEASRVEAVGRGAQEPADAADPYAAVNRRVRIVNVDAGASP
jgi:outer membrane protein OmpA-like peptidoglycan-associated protein